LFIQLLLSFAGTRGFLRCFLICFLLCVPPSVVFGALCLNGLIDCLLVLRAQFIQLL
jgi:hypothetical protein